MIRYMILKYAVEAMLQTGRKIEIVEGIPPDYTLIRAALSGSILELVFDRKENFCRDEVIVVKDLE